MRSFALAALLVACAPKPAPPAAATPAGPPIERPATRVALSSELVVEGPVAQRVSTSPADLVVYYGGEHKGSMETCGCPKRPRGSFARFSAYVQASRAANPGVPDLVVNAGYWLQDAMGFDGQLRTDLTLANRWMVDGSRALGWDALNVGYPDVAGLATLVPDGQAPLPLVSANVTGPGVNRWVILDKGGVRVGVTGITAQGQLLSETPGFTIAPPQSAGPVLDALAKEVDVVVLLAYQATDVAKALALEHPVDVVIDAAMWRDYVDPAYAGGAAWVATSFQTMRLGELRLLVSDGAVVGGVARHVDLDPDVPDDPALAALTRKARVELDREQQAIYGAP
jgi:2',3'-cyclic-nucleotide 2'-phosphodiesterase (5'-nucleotidase family)